MRGLLTVFGKELADNFISWRGIILFSVVVLAVILAIYGPSGSLQNIREELSIPTQFGPTQYVFIKLFTASGESLIPFPNLIIMIVVPVVAIALGFDAINGEKHNGTMSRLLAQPIYRDAVLNGKFLAGLVAIAIMLTTIILLISGVGLRILGVPPSPEEALRLFLFLGLAILYGAFWLSLAMLFSVFLKRIATSALATIAVWLFFIFFDMIAGFVANTMAPLSEASTTQDLLRNTEVYITALRVSPIALLQEAATVLLVPGARTMGALLQFQHASEARFMPGALTLGESLNTIWPHLLIIVAISAVFFTVSYIKFMREEIRST